MPKAKKEEFEVMMVDKVGFASSKDGRYIMLDCEDADGEHTRIAVPTLKISHIASVLFKEAQSAAARLPNDEVIEAAASALENDGGDPLLVTGMKLTSDCEDLMVGLGFTILRLSLCDEARQEIKRCVKAMHRKQGEKE